MTLRREPPPTDYGGVLTDWILPGALALVSAAMAVRVHGYAGTVREREEDLATVSRLARALATAPEARTAACAAARDLTGASWAMLWEPLADGAFMVTAAESIDAPRVRLVPHREPSLVVRAASDRRAIVVTDVAAHPDANPRLVTLAGAAGALRFEPVRQGDAVVGVLVVAWEDARDATARRVRRLLPLLAGEAAVSIERADLVTRLAGLALTDDLTTLGNRRAWDDWIGRALNAADAAPLGDPAATLSVALLDIDSFKRFNDTHGHQEGDRLLREAAIAWRGRLRPGDRLARYGGEEFAVLLTGCDESNAAIVIERLRAATPLGETCSAGIAGWDGHEAAHELLGRADEALYAAKQAGRDRSATAQRPVALV
jgi:diguanylate cyclase (GGDEF)-like protein